MQKYGIVLEEKKFFRTIFQQKETFWFSKYFAKYFFDFGKVFTKWISKILPTSSVLENTRAVKISTNPYFQRKSWGYATTTYLLQKTNWELIQTNRHLIWINSQLVFTKSDIINFSWGKEMKTSLMLTWTTAPNNPNGGIKATCWQVENTTYQHVGLICLYEREVTTWCNTSYH